MMAQGTTILTDDVIARGAAMVIVGLQCWQIKSTLSLNKRVDGILTYLFGPPELLGKNGLNQKVNEMRKDLDEVLRRHEGER